jgi:hypothetical protein
MFTSGSIFQQRWHFSPDATRKSILIPLASSLEKADLGALSKDSSIEEVIHMSANGILFKISNVCWSSK